MSKIVSPEEAQRIRVLFGDQLGLARGKYIPRRFAKHGEARFCAGAYAVTYAKDLIDAPGAYLLEGLPDIEAQFNIGELRQGWEDNTAIALSNLTFKDAPYELCGRTAMANAISAWNEKGLTPMIGFETEAYIFQRGENGDWVPYDTPGSFVYGTGPFTDPAGLTDQIWAMAEKCDIKLESLNAEYDSPQFELTLCYDEAMKACDDLFLFKLMARELLFKQGYLLCFMPKPILELSGTGLHLNFSLKDKKGKNIFARDTETGPLPEIMAGCVAGLVKHHQALGGLLAPTVNSYARLKPASLSGYWANWGYDHRSAAVRISAETGSGSRIEHRQGDCAVSPYIAGAALLNAALLGVDKGYKLPPAEDGDGLEAVNTDICVAENLAGSLEHLSKDKALCEKMGQTLIDNYLAIKGAEIKELDGKSHQEVFDYYAPFI